jgi:hypothetical protein
LGSIDFRRGPSNHRIILVLKMVRIRSKEEKENVWNTMEIQHAVAKKGDLKFSVKIKWSRDFSSESGTVVPFHGKITK